MTIERGSAGGENPRGDWEALARYLAGESSPAEAEAMRRLLAESPDDEALVRALERAIASLPQTQGAHGEIDVDAALNRVVARRDGRSHPSPATLTLARGGARVTARDAKVTRRPSWIAPAIAAAAVLAIAIGTWRADRGASPDAVVAAAPQLLRTAVGQRDSIRLSDGSHVVLAPMSELSFAVVGNERVATLTGEGYFDVVHDESQPFVVHAGDALIRDIGTTFTVTRSEEQEVTVVVTSGIVELGGRDATTPPQQGKPASKSSVRLEKGDVGVRRADGTTTLKRGAATDDATAWTRGALVFRDASFKEVADRLRRWHGIELRAGDATIAGRTVTADLTGEDADRVLELLSLSLGAELQRQGSLAVLREAGGGGRRP